MVMKNISKGSCVSRRGQLRIRKNWNPYIFFQRNAYSNLCVLTSEHFAYIENNDIQCIKLLFRLWGLCCFNSEKDNLWFLYYYLWVFWVFENCKFLCGLENVLPKPEYYNFICYPSLSWFWKLRASDWKTYFRCLHTNHYKFQVFLSQSSLPPHFIQSIMTHGAVVIIIIALVIWPHLNLSKFEICDLFPFPNVIWCTHDYYQ